MTPQRLLEHFDRISDAPDAIPRLRRFILDLAVRGKLVKQDPRDEPASELLKRIEAEKERLVNTGNMRRQVEISQVEETEFPFEIPASWYWVRLIGVLNKLTDGTHHSPTNLADGAFKYITAKNIKPEGVSLANVSYVTAKVHHEIYARCNPEKGDILYIKDGATTGIVTINDLDEPFSMLSSVALLKLSTSVYNRLIVEFLRSPFFYEQMRGFMKGAAITRVTLKRMAPALIPLPPLAEQHRIVAKVDELMALCDHLEAAQAERENRRDRLVASSLNRLNNDADSDAFRDHARFYFNHLPCLTTKPEHIQQLRQTILNLAVRGKLVPQDIQDEPVSVLLEQIQSEQEELIKARVLKPNIEDSQLVEEDLPFAIPPTWQWVSLRRIIVFGPQNGISPKPSSQHDAPRAITLTATTSGQFDPQHFKRVEATIPLDSEYWLRSGDLLFQRGNTRDYVGIAAYYTGEPRLFLYPDLMMKVRITQKTSLRYVHLCAIAPLARAYFSTHATGAQATMPKINQGILLQLPIPLPPLAEQQRIVAKVDELMAPCDKVEAQLTTTHRDSRLLLEAVLHEALAPVVAS